MWKIIRNHVLTAIITVPVLQILFPLISGVSVHTEMFEAYLLSFCLQGMGWGCLAILLSLACNIGIRGTKANRMAIASCIAITVIALARVMKNLRPWWGLQFSSVTAALLAALILSIVSAAVMLVIGTKFDLSVIAESERPRASIGRRSNPDILWRKKCSRWRRSDPNIKWHKK